MTAFNVVRFKVKPGHDQDFIDAHKVADPGFPGMRKFSLFSTGPGSYCIVGEWDSFDAIVAARAGMIGMLDTMRDMLEDIGNGLGVTDPVSGSAILEMGSKKPKKKAAKRTKPAKKAVKKATKKPAKKSAKRKKK